MRYKNRKKILHRGAFSPYLIDMHTDAAHWLLLHLHIYYTIAHTLLNKDTSGLCAAFSFYSYIALSIRSYIPYLCLYGNQSIEILIKRANVLSSRIKWRIFR